MMSVVGWFARVLSFSSSLRPSSDKRQLWRSLRPKMRMGRRKIVPGKVHPVSRDGYEGLVVMRLVPSETWSPLARDPS